MTTDITELAQREKFEAWLSDKPFHARYMHWSNTLNAYDYTGIQLAWEAYQAGGAELVEALGKSESRLHEVAVACATAEQALEKAQRANGHLREQSAEWERKAISNFEDCAEMSARIEELESQRKLAFTACNRWADKFREAEKRIAELESRSVTVKLPDLRQVVSGDRYVWSDGVFNYSQDVKAELTAKGIKWEAE